MVGAFRWFLLFCACAAMAQQAAPPPNYHLVMGLEGAKDGVRGALAVAAGALVFTPSKGDAVKVPVSEIQDVSIGADSKRTFSGIGQVTMLGPYGSGRFFSLFRDKLDVLTVAYRDENGALHGAIFSMKPGLAVPIKKELLAAGAPSSTPLPEPKPMEANKADAGKKVEPAAKKKEAK